MNVSLGTNLKVPAPVRSLSVPSISSEPASRETLTRIVPLASGADCDSSRSISLAGNWPFHEKGPAVTCSKTNSRLSDGLISHVPATLSREPIGCSAAIAAAPRSCECGSSDRPISALRASADAVVIVIAASGSSSAALTAAPMSHMRRDGVVRLRAGSRIARIRPSSLRELAMPTTSAGARRPLQL
jgi:hypothetical protein